MSNITKLTVGKGKTTSDEKQNEWIKHYFDLEIELDDPSDVEIAKANASGLIEACQHLHYVVTRGDAEVDKKLSNCPGKIRSG